MSRGVRLLGYLGPNGAGKTTTIRLLLGMLRPSSDRAEIFGLDVQRETVAAHRRVAYVPGEASLWLSLTVEETLHLLGRTHGRTDPAYRDELVDARRDAAPFPPSRSRRRSTPRPPTCHGSPGSATSPVGQRGPGALDVAGHTATTHEASRVVLPRRFAGAHLEPAFCTRVTATPNSCNSPSGKT